MKTKQRYRSAIIWLVALVCNPVAGADWQQADYIIDSFFEIALKNEYTTQAQTVRKWAQTGIRYAYVHRVQDEMFHQQLSDTHLRHLQAITGLNIQETQQRNEANLIIVFTTEAELKNDLKTFFNMQSPQELDYFFRNSVCLANVAADNNGIIQAARVIIPIDRARHRAKLLDCVVEELTQIMGLPNDSDKVVPSIFNDRSVDHLLSGLDYVLLKILYDPRLKPNMNKTQAMPVVKTMVSDLIKNGTVEQADKIVQSSGLYPLLQGSK